MSDVAILRDLATDGDLRAAVRLQQRVWGDAHGDVVGPALLKVARSMGGVAAGAFGPTDELIGLVFGIAGRYAGEPAHWSHLLAVEPTARDMGLGQRLKQYQKAQVVEADIHTMYWTFDPLVARNAHLNLNKLGAVIIDYVPAFYGEPSSTLDLGIGTDRVVVRWDLTDLDPPDSVTRRTEGSVCMVSPDTPQPEDTQVAFIRVPQDIQALKANEPERARAWREVSRTAFRFYLDRGYAVVGYVVEGGGCGGYRLEAS